MTNNPADSNQVPSTPQGATPPLDNPQNVVSEQLQTPSTTNVDPVTPVDQSPVTGIGPTPETAPPPPIIDSDTKPAYMDVESQASGNNTNPPSTSDSGSTTNPPPKKKVSGKVIAGFIGLLVLAGGLFAGLQLVGQRQEIREQAGTATGCFEPPEIYKKPPQSYQLGETSSPGSVDWVLFPIKEECANVQSLTNIFGELEQAPAPIGPNVYTTRNYAFTFNRILSIEGYDTNQIQSGHPSLTEDQLHQLHLEGKDVQSIQDCDYYARQLVFDLTGQNDPKGLGRKFAKPNTANWSPRETGYYQFDITPNFKCEGSAQNQPSLGAGFIRVVSAQEPTPEPTPTVTPPQATTTPTPPQEDIAYCQAKQAYRDSAANTPGQYTYSQLIETGGSVAPDETVVFRTRLRPLGFNQPSTFTDVLDNRLEFVDSVGQGTACNYSAATRTFTCNVPSIANSDSAAVIAFRARVKQDATGTIENRATMTTGNTTQESPCRTNFVVSTTPPLAACLDLRVYNNTTEWKQMTVQELKQLKPGDKIILAVKGAGSGYDKAHFRVNNNTEWGPDITNVNSEGYFYVEYTLSPNTTTFKIEAQVHHKATNQWY